jgi:hypothetical protein
MADRSERLVAGQLADVKESLDSMRETMGKRAPPQVTIHVPEQPVNVRVPENVPPNIHLNFEAAQPTQVKFDVPQLPPPIVKVDAPVVNVLPPEPRIYDVEITSRDSAGFIKSFRITPA